MPRPIPILSYHWFVATSLLLSYSAVAQPSPPALPRVEQPTFRRDTVDIRRLGAMADGQTLNTSAITQAIEQCSRNGGGTVLIPRGLWLAGPIVLKSHVNLHLAEGALLQFTNDRLAYPLVKTTWEGRDAIRCQAPLSATDAEDIAITGTGVIDGAGDAWRMVKKSKLTADQWKKRVASGGVVNAKGDTWYPSAQSLRGATEVESGKAPTSLNPADFADTRDFLRPNLLSLTRCRRVLLDGITFQNSPAWCLHPLLCEQVTLRNLTVRNPWYAQNGDGLDLESCRNSVVDNCTFDVGDDGICLKSGRDEEGRKRGVPTENVLVSNCRVYNAHGGFVIGSEMSGGVRNVLVKNCAFMGTDVGLRFKTARGRGGIVENIYVDGVDMTDIAGEAILFDMYYMAKDPVPQQGESNELPEIAAQPLSDATPRFRQFTVRNVTCRGAETAILIRGLPEMAVSDILIEDAVLQSRKGLVCIEADRVALKRVSLLCTTTPVMQFQNSRHVTLDTIQYPASTAVLTNVTGNRSADIRLLHTDTSKAQQEISLGSTVAAGSYSHR